MLAQDAPGVNGFAPKNKRSSIHPKTAFALKMLLEGRALNGELDAVPSSDKPFIAHLNTLKTDDRKTVFDAFKYLCADPDAVAKAVFAADGTELDQPAPRTATLADAAILLKSDRWLWNGWLLHGALNAIAAQPGTGKTRFLMDLTRRVWHGEPWPDGQPITIPPKTPTLWIAGDQHFQELLVLARDFDVPPESIHFNTSTDDPLLGLSLDDATTRHELAERIRSIRPAFVAIDTIGMSTVKNLTRPEEANAFYSPILQIGNQTQTCIIAVTHLSKDQDPLGRRIVEKCRVVIKMTQPDPEGLPNRRRLWVDKSAAIKPPPRGVTMGDSGNEYDLSPPSEPVKDWSAGRSSGTGKRGPEPAKLEKAKTWLRDRLQAGPEWMRDTFKAAESMIDAGEFSKSLVYDAAKALNVEQFQDEQGKKYWRLPVPEADDEPNKDDF
jgi:hypothetical protein